MNTGVCRSLGINVWDFFFWRGVYTQEWNYWVIWSLWTSQGALVVKNTLANAGDVRDAGSIPGSGRSPGGGRGNPLQYTNLDNPVDRGAWRATVHGVTKSQT